MKISRSEQFSPNLEQGTDELRAKHVVEILPVDYRGLMRRAHVADQTLLDTLFLRREITAPQHSAGEHLLDVVVRSGGTPRSSDPSAVSLGTPLRDAERAMSFRIMIAAGAYRALAGAGEQAERDTFIVILHGVQGATPKRDKGFMDNLRKGLNALVGYFGTAGVRDPRSTK